MTESIKNSNTLSESAKRREFDLNRIESDIMILKPSNIVELFRRGKWKRML